jgi:two-component system nitrate/nitrite response regulator NarL
MGRSPAVRVATVITRLEGGAGQLAVSTRTKVLVLSADPGTDGIRQALHAGASGYLHKTRGVSALTRAIERVQRGEVVVDVPKPARGWRRRPTPSVIGYWMMS